MGSWYPTMAVLKQISAAICLCKAQAVWDMGERCWFRSLDSFRRRTPGLTRPGCWQPLHPSKTGSVPAQDCSEHATVAFSASKVEAHLPYMGSLAGTSLGKGGVEVPGGTQPKSQGWQLKNDQWQLQVTGTGKRDERAVRKWGMWWVIEIKCLSYKWGSSVQKLTLHLYSINHKRATWR